MGTFNLRNNWKILAVACSLVIIVLVLVLGAASFHIFLACPLMMIFMMGGMSHGGHVMHGDDTTQGEQSHNQSGNEQDWQIRQLQGQLHQLQQEQALLREQLKQVPEKK